MTVTIDLNVLIDIYLLRGDYEAAMRVLSLCKTGVLVGNSPSHAAPTVYYILRKGLGRPEAKRISQELLQVLDIVPVDKELLLAAHQSALDDFEDAIVEVSAIHASSSHIVTGNIRDFEVSRIPAVSPSQFLFEVFGETI